MKNLTNLLLLSLALLFSALGFRQFIRYREFQGIEIRQELLKQGIRQADRIKDTAYAIRHYESLNPRIPEIRLRILLREWETVSEILKQISEKISSGSPVKSDFENLIAGLDPMEEQCDRLIEQERISEDIRWQAFNLRGAVRLSAAYAALESGKNEKKAAALMKAALADLKSAVKSVDKADRKGWERNIPRWNTELLFTEAEIRKIGFALSDAPHRLNLRENTEPLIPEKSGYASGEPPDHRIEK